MRCYWRFSWIKNKDGFILSRRYSFFSEHIKVNGVNENAVAKKCHSKCKDVLLNKKCFRHSMKKMQSKNYKIGTYKISKIYNGFDQSIRVDYSLLSLWSSQSSFLSSYKNIILIFALVRADFLSTYNFGFH